MGHAERKTGDKATAGLGSRGSTAVRSPGNWQPEGMLKFVVSDLPRPRPPHTPHPRGVGELHFSREDRKDLSIQSVSRELLN